VHSCTFCPLCVGFDDPAISIKISVLHGSGKKPAGCLFTFCPLSVGFDDPTISIKASVLHGSGKSLLAVCDVSHVTVTLTYVCMWAHMCLNRVPEFPGILLVLELRHTRIGMIVHLVKRCITGRNVPGSSLALTSKGAALTLNELEFLHVRWERSVDYWSLICLAQVTPDIPQIFLINDNWSYMQR
jgi:hypothetical protein